MLSTNFQKNRLKIPITSMLNLRLKCARFYDMGIKYTQPTQFYINNAMSKSSDITDHRPEVQNITDHRSDITGHRSHITDHRSQD